MGISFAELVSETENACNQFMCGAHRVMFRNKEFTNPYALYEEFLYYKKMLNLSNHLKEEQEYFEKIQEWIRQFQEASASEPAASSGMTM